MTQTTVDVAIFSTLNQDDFTHSEIKRAEIHSMAAMDVVTQYGSIAAKLRGQTPFAIHGWTSIPNLNCFTITQWEKSYEHLIN